MLQNKHETYSAYYTSGTILRTSQIINAHISPKWWVLFLSLLKRWGHWGPEKWSDLLKSTQAVMGFELRWPDSRVYDPLCDYYYLSSEGEDETKVRDGTPYSQPGHFPAKPSPKLDSFQTQGFKAQMNYLCNPSLCREAAKKGAHFAIHNPTIWPPLQKEEPTRKGHLASP